jgi:hypothetical protein
MRIPNKKRRRIMFWLVVLIIMCKEGRIGSSLAHGPSKTCAQRDLHLSMRQYGFGDGRKLLNTHSLADILDEIQSVRSCNTGKPPLHAHSTREFVPTLRIRGGKTGPNARLEPQKGDIFVHHNSKEV